MANRLLINYIAEPVFDQDPGISLAHAIGKHDSAWRPDLDLNSSQFNRKRNFSLVLAASVGSATVPTGISGHGGPPYDPKHVSYKVSEENEVGSRNAEVGMKAEGRSRNVENWLLHHVQYLCLAP